jgi:uncharacterized spore protein YtfJ
MECRDGGFAVLPEPIKILNQTPNIMKVNLETVLPKITDFLKSEAKTETIIGEQFKLGEYSCVPVMRIGMGFGSGGGEGSDPKKGHGEGLGVGGGMGMEPIGFLVSRGEEIKFLPTREKSGFASAFEKAPELLEKYMEQQKQESATPA